MEEFNDQEISRLLRLKRHEQPPPGYFEDFLHEFQRRQRDELLRQPLWQIAWQRAQDYMMRLDISRLASYPAAVAAVLICAGVMSLRIYEAPREARMAVVAPAQAVVAAVPRQSDWSLALRPAAATMVAAPSHTIFNPNLSTRRKATPPRYVLDSMPVSYEQSLRF